MSTTPHLPLVPALFVHIELLLSIRSNLSRALGVTVPDGGSQFAHAVAQPTPDPPLPPHDWGNGFVIHREANALVGNGGFKGAPDKAGRVWSGELPSKALGSVWRWSIRRGPTCG